MTWHYYKTSASEECNKRVEQSLPYNVSVNVFLGSSWNLRWLREGGARDTLEGDLGWGVFPNWNSCLQFISFWTPEGDADLLNSWLPCSKFEILETSLLFLFLMWELMLNWIFVRWTMYFAQASKKVTEKAIETTWMSKLWGLELGDSQKGAGQGCSFLCGEALVIHPLTPS